MISIVFPSLSTNVSGDVRKFVEYISYPGNPSLTRQADEDSTENSDQEDTDTSNPGGKGDSDSSDTEVNASADNSDGSDIISTSPLTLVDSDGNTIEINYILHKDYSCEYRGDDGMKYTDNGNETYTVCILKVMLFQRMSQMMSVIIQS